MTKFPVYFFISLFAYLFIPPSWVAAAGEFQANYDVQYNVSPTGTTISTQTITLTNKLTNLYPQKYSILIDSTNIKNVIAYDKGGPISPEITQRDGKTEILLAFNEKVVGLGKSLQFTLRFENGDIAQKNGTIWEVNIPGIAVDPDIDKYTVSLSVPSSFGPNAYMTPLPANGSRWTREQMTNGGISAAYGTEQIFDLTLSYYIENQNVTPQTQEIALPPDTAYQTITINEFTPKPDTVRRDTDENWLARYTLTPGEKLDITARLTATITLSPKEAKVDAATLANYLTPDQYWETTNSKIVSLANEYRTPRAIYDYVVSTLSYSYDRVNQNPIRKGAVAALANPAASVCMEFTDLFIAIARAAGIPARESVGYAYTTNTKLRPLSLVTDVLHAWPEYFDPTKETWIPVDPTWEKTTGGVNYFDKFDFNHIVFTTHGSSSTSPYPAGSYRKSGNEGKTVQVRFATPQVPAPEAGELTLHIDFPKQITAGMETRGTVSIQNTSGMSVDEAIISIQSSPVDVAITKTERNIPPFASIQIPISLTIPNAWTRSNGRITAQVNDASAQEFFVIQPFYGLLLPAAAVFAVFLLVVIIFIARPHALWTIFKKP